MSLQKLTTVEFLPKCCCFDNDNSLSFMSLVKGQGSRRVKIGPVTKINEIWLYCMCMSSVTENDSF